VKNDEGEGWGRSLKEWGGMKFLPLKRRVGLERAYLIGGVIEDLRYSKLYNKREVYFIYVIK